MASEPFGRARLSTRFLPEHFADWRPSDQDLKDAAIAAFLLAEGLLGDNASAASRRDGAGARSDASSHSPWGELAGFTIGGSR
jgi:hypothetical protein